LVNGARPPFRGRKFLFVHEGFPYEGVGFAKHHVLRLFLTIRACRFLANVCDLAGIAISTAHQNRPLYVRNGSWQAVWHLLGKGYFLGPARYQTMTPMTGNTRIMIIQSTFLPVDAPP
jgi:hypothetical protein